MGGGCAGERLGFSVTPAPGLLAQQLRAHRSGGALDPWAPAGVPSCPPCLPAGFLGRQEGVGLGIRCVGPDPQHGLARAPMESREIRCLARSL